jgi:hypothetical protein
LRQVPQKYLRVQHGDGRLRTLLHGVHKYGGQELGHADPHFGPHQLVHHHLREDLRRFLPQPRGVVVAEHVQQVEDSAFLMRLLTILRDSKARVCYWKISGEKGKISADVTRGKNMKEETIKEVKKRGKTKGKRKFSRNTCKKRQYMVGKKWGKYRDFVRGQRLFPGAGGGGAKPF